MATSNDLTAGMELIHKMYEANEWLSNAVNDMEGKGKANGRKLYKWNEPNIHDMRMLRDLTRNAVHRLAWLETVVKGLTYAEQHDAALYAKFVDKKRNLEDLDLEELRALLR